MSDKKSFSQVEAVRDVVQNLKDGDKTRAENRALIATLFNGEPPYTVQEAEENHIETNVNFLEGTKIALDARSQFNNAFLKSSNFFTVEIDLPDSTIALKNEKIVKKAINRIMKRSLAYTETLRGQFASVVLHGIGPVVWPNRDSWCPDPFAVGDVLVPDRTRMDMRNLGYFTIRREWTPYELLKMTHGERVVSGWNMPLVRKLLASLVKKKYEGKGMAYDLNFWERPEEVAELMKENALYWASTAVPTIACWDFYYQDCEDDAGEWKRCIIVEDTEGTDGAEKKQFLYRPDKAYEPEWSRIIHWQFGDSSNTSPARYNALRSLGWLLYSVLQLQNRLRCKFSDAVFENLLQYFRVTNPQDIDRVQRVDLHHLGIWPEGLNSVKNDERYTPSPDLINNLLQQNRQLMAESASSYVSNVDDGRQREMTASEVIARQNAANAIVSSMLNMAFTYQGFQHTEICRRFLNKKSRDKDVIKFHEMMKREQVPAVALEFERWTVTPERVLGAGNKTVEMLEAQQLMAVRGMLDPDAQRIVVHKYVLANSDDARLADRLVPFDKQLLPSETVVEAQQAAGTLLMGLPVGIRSGVNRGEYVGALLQSLAVIVSRVEKSGGVPQSPVEFMGMQNLAQHIAQNIQLFAQDTQAKDQLRQFQSALSKLGNFIRAFGQRLQKEMESKQNGNGGADPELIAEIQKDLMLTQQKLRAKEMAAGQRLQQKERQFISEEQRKDMELRNRLAREGAEFGLDQRLKDADKALEIQRETSAPEPEATAE